MLTDTVLAGKSIGAITPASKAVRLAHLLHLLTRELRVGMSFTMIAVRAASVATLGNHVPVVVALGANPKMLGVDAMTTVAMMQHALAFRDRPVCKLISQAMSV